MIGRLSIGAKIALFTGALVLFVAAGLSIFGYLYTSNLVLDQVEATLITHATQAAKRIESELRTETEVLRAFALQPGLDSMGSHVQRLTLSEYLDRMASFLALAVVSPSGTAYYADGTMADLSDRDYVQKALTGVPAISDILISRVTNEQVIMIAVPIMRGETVVGAVIGRKDSTFLSDVIMRLGVGEFGWAAIVGADGTFLAHKDHQQVLNSVNIFDPESEYAPLGAAVAESGLQQAQIVTYLHQELGNTIVASVPISTTGWALMVGSLEKEMIADVQRLGITLLISTVGFIIVGVVLAVLIGRIIAKPLQNVQAVMDAVSQGDMTRTVTIKHQDEVGKAAQAINRTMENVRKVLEVMADAVRILTVTSAEMAAASEEVSASIEEVASTTNEFSSTLDQMYINAQSMNDTANRISSDASKGEQALMEIVTEMKKLKQGTSELVEKMQVVSESSEKIGVIVNTINDIADQTNLLALNAAIEAARAGEHGRGFAVVADEVRNLAEESSAATAEITQLIKQTQQAIADAVAEMYEETEQVDHALRVIQTSEGLLQNILQAIENVVKEMQEILKGIKEANVGGHEIASSTEEQAATIQEIAASAQELTNMAAKLQQQIEFFKLNDEPKE